jgi:hypothetical protein
LSSAVIRKNDDLRLLEAVIARDSAGVIWTVQVALIVWGHVVAVIEAHRVSLSVQRQPRTALAAQTPLVLLMVSYTFAGLWVLGKSLSGG